MITHVSGSVSRLLRPHRRRGGQSCLVLSSPSPPSRVTVMMMRSTRQPVADLLDGRHQLRPRRGAPESLET